jgi:hypothetical protein
MKIKVSLITILLSFLVQNDYIKKSWFNSEIRSFLFISQYEYGDCLVHKRGFWGREKKRVIGMKYADEKDFYLLKDVDRRGFLGKYPKKQIEYWTTKVDC